MKKLLLIGILFGAGIFASLGFISSGGGGGDASNARHADNLDNGVGTNAILSGQFTGIFGFQQNVNPAAISAYNPVIFEEAVYGNGAPFIATTPGGGYSTLLTPDGIELNANPVFNSVAGDGSGLFNLGFPNPISLKDDGGTQRATLTGLTTPAHGAILHVDTDQNLLISEHLLMGDGMAFSSVTDDLSVKAGLEFRASVIGLTADSVKFNNNDFILTDGNSNGGTTIGIKASDDGTQMYLHVTSAGVLTITTSPF